MRVWHLNISENNTFDGKVMSRFTILFLAGKILAGILLNKVHPKLVTHQRHELSGFTPKKSTVDRILALPGLTERLRRFRTGLWVANVDLSQAFVSANRNVFWRILALRRTHPELFNVIFGWNAGTESALRCDGTISTPLALLPS